MDAVSASRSVTDQNHNDAGRDQVIKIEFDNADGKYPPSFYLLLVQLC